MRRSEGEESRGATGGGGGGEGEQSLLVNGAEVAHREDCVPRGVDVGFGGFLSSTLGVGGSLPNPLLHTSSTPPSLHHLLTTLTQSLASHLLQSPNSCIHSLLSSSRSFVSDNFSKTWR